MGELFLGLPRNWIKITLSTAESEHVAAMCAAKEALWLWQIIAKIQGMVQVNSWILMGLDGLDDSPLHNSLTLGPNWCTVTPNLITGLKLCRALAQSVLYWFAWFFFFFLKSSENSGLSFNTSKPVKIHRLTHAIPYQDLPTSWETDYPLFRFPIHHHTHKQWFISTWTKHIDIWYHFICFKIQNKSINLVYCPTDNMIVDIPTKALPNIKAKSFARSLRLLPTWGEYWNQQFQYSYSSQPPRKTALACFMILQHYSWFYDKGEWWSQVLGQYSGFKCYHGFRTSSMWFPSPICDQGWGH